MKLYSKQLVFWHQDGPYEFNFYDDLSMEISNPNYSDALVEGLTWRWNPEHRQVEWKRDDEDWLLPRFSSDITSSYDLAVTRKVLE